MAARPLNETIQRAFNNNTVGRGKVSYYSNNISNTGFHYLEIPIRTNVFEIPVLAIKDFLIMTLKGTDTVDALSIVLYNEDIKAVYTTPDRNMRDILIVLQENGHLVNIPVSHNGNTSTYYGGHGMLLNEDFKLLVLMSWQIERILDTAEDGTQSVKYQFIKPIIRIDPTCFGGSDPMMKWCANKLFKTGLSEKVAFPSAIVDSNFIMDNVQYMSPSIIIEESPFNIRIPDIPDALTTKEDIFQPVIDHIDELIQ